MISFRRPKKEPPVEAKPAEQKKSSSFGRLRTLFHKKPGAAGKPCQACGTTNPAEVLYCRECGKKYACTAENSPDGIPGIHKGAAACGRSENDDPKLWLEKGNALYKSGQYQKALEMYDYAIRIDQQYSKAWNNRSLVLKKMGREKEASDSRERYLVLQNAGSGKSPSSPGWK